MHEFAGLLVCWLCGRSQLSKQRVSGQQVSESARDFLLPPKQSLDGAPGVVVERAGSWVRFVDSQVSKSETLRLRSGRALGHPAPGELWRCGAREQQVLRLRATRSAQDDKVWGCAQRLRGFVDSQVSKSETLRLRSGRALGHPGSWWNAPLQGLMARGRGSRGCWCFVWVGWGV
jgi:hypothetical protein